MGLREADAVSGCLHCGHEVEQPRTGRRRKFCSAKCKQRAYRAERAFRNAARSAISASWWEVLHAITYSAVRTWGGHREVDADSAIDACRRSPKIDARLVQILGGVPLPRAPRAAVVELRPLSHPLEDELAA